MKNTTSDIMPKVGIFDSGIGGFSVLKEVRGKTEADILYFGDCARAPYGNRSSDEILLFIEEIVSNLKKQEVTHFVSACNSMSVMMTNIMLHDCGIDEVNYVDMIRAFKEYSTFSKGDVVLVVGTQVTIESGAYQETLTEKQIPVREYVFKTLAGLIEREASRDDLYEVIELGILYAKKVGATHLVYGCTHYPLVDEIFKHCAKKNGWSGAFVDPACYVGEAVAKWNLLGARETFFEASEVTTPFSTLASSYNG
jgi:glutamate racemase